MNKKICVTLLLLLFLCACSINTDTLSQDEPSIFTPQNGDSLYCLDSVDILFEQGDNYKIFANEEHTIFHYIIYDQDGDTIDEGYHGYRGSFDIVADGDLLTLDYGHGGSSWYERYYDVSNGRISRFFERPIQASGELVAYFDFEESSDRIVLVVQNRFDQRQYYKEIARDFSDFVLKDEVKAEFLDNDTKLKITYWTSPDNQLITETIDIR